MYTKTCPYCKKDFLTLNKNAKYCSHTCANKNREIVPILDRFWKYVSKKGIDECWEWIGSQSYGYGEMSIKSGNWERRAHRFSWELHNNKKIPKGLCICHHCDNPLCVNPNHLFLGTRKDNNEDKANKGRNARNKGEKNGQAKLTEKEVLEIRKLYIPRKYTQKMLAKRFNISQQTIEVILNRKKWIHI